MKKMLTAALLTGAGVFALSGCIKKKNDDPQHWMKATIGTTNFNVTSCSGIELGGQMSIDGYTKTGGLLGAPQIDISIRNWGTGGTGTYYVGSSLSTDSTNVTYKNAAGTTSTSQSGTVVITSLTASEITGTFSVVCTDGVTITNGSFNVSKI